MAVNVVSIVDDWIKIQRVLLSVYDKTGLELLVPALVKISPEVHFYSTGGTFGRIAEILGEKEAAARLTQVSEYTGQPETQGGLVKTLDFKIYLGLLTETYNEYHQADLNRTGALPLDMVVGNLYPFEETVAREGVTVEQARSNIDIGGPCMIRASAKNYLRVASVVNPADYPDLIKTLQANNGKLDMTKRFELAQKAFAHTAAYDAAIGQFLAKQKPAAVLDTYTPMNGSQS